ncbi:MAG: N-acetylglucosamine-6-phosphate deacetylase [Caldilinea sp. CFX5]|nr:N-acetylglucosamine-6-phosphate deacetylase [Caldilinea sp. CFX5]
MNSSVALTALQLRHGLLPAEFAPANPPATGQAGFVTGDVLTVSDQIQRVGDIAADGTVATLDATGCFVLPGFIDVHVHGGDGSDAMDATPEALTRMATFFAQHGVTAFLATTMTAPHDAILAAVAAVGQWGEKITTGARLVGVHVEGPYISLKFPGAQPAAYIRPPSLAEFAELVAAGPVRMITLAPEVDGAAELIAAARQQGVTVVWGHTNATYEECVLAADRGVTQATHTYNAMSGLHHRKPGVLGATLTLDQIYAQLIADNIHVHPAAMNVLARCKGVDRTVLITDAMRAAGLPEGEYELGGQPVTVSDGSCRLADGTLAGSILTMERALINFMAATGLPLAAAWPATSRIPAQSLGLGQRYGALRPGYQADLVLLDAGLQVAATVVGGQIVYLQEPSRLSKG